MTKTENIIGLGAIAITVIYFAWGSRACYLPKLMEMWGWM